jgi:hypothetical protein
MCICWRSSLIIRLLDSDICAVFSFFGSPKTPSRGGDRVREKKARVKLVNLRTFSFANVRMPYIILNHINQAAYTHYSPFTL